jgi:hypothetical protein
MREAVRRFRRAAADARRAVRADNRRFQLADAAARAPREMLSADAPAADYALSLRFARFYFTPDDAFIAAADGHFRYFSSFSFHTPLPRRLLRYFRHFHYFRHAAIFDMLMPPLIRRLLLPTCRWLFITFPTVCHFRCRRACAGERAARCIRDAHFRRQLRAVAADTPRDAAMPPTRR